MIRSVLAVLALVILPGIIVPSPVGAQQEARTHEVREGDTLWRIAQQYYGDGALWNRIFDANRDRLDEPGALDVGLVLTIPEAGAEPARAAPAAEEPVAEEAAAAAEDPVPEEAAAEAEEAMAEVGGVEVQAPEAAPAPEVRPQAGVGPKPIDRRTAFYPDTSNPTLRGEMAPMLSAVSRDAVFSAPWFVRPGEAIAQQGEIIDFAGSEGHVTVRSSAHPHDELLISFDGPAPAVGSLVHVYRAERNVVDLGTVVVPTGIVRITELQPAGAVGEVVKLYARMKLGDRVGPLPAYPLSEGQRAAAEGDGSEARIIGFANARPMYSIGDIAFLDAAPGAAIGDEYVVVYRPGEGWSGSAEGRLQVIRVGDDHVTARILAEERPVFTMGARVRLDRRMR